MDFNDWIILITSLGGIEGIKQGIKFYMNRKAESRKEDATADSMENENERKQIDWLEKRLSERDSKIDSIYAELRKEQSDHLEDVHKRYEIELQLKETEIKRCDVRGCIKRMPPSDY